MADVIKKQMKELEEKTTVADDDILLIQETTDSNKKVTKANLLKELNQSKTDILNTIGTETMGTTATTLKGAVKELGSQLNENVQDLAKVKTDYAKKTDVNTLASNKADIIYVDNIANSKANKTDLTVPFTFKGSCLNANLPTNASVNDTWYCTDLQYRKTWNGTAWFQSSLEESLYNDNINSIKTDVNNSNDGIQLLDAIFVNGAVTNGILYTPHSNIISSDKVFEYDRDIILHVKNGFKYRFDFINPDGSFNKAIGVGSEDILIPSNQKFMINISKIDSSDLTPTEGRNAVYFNTKIIDYIGNYDINIFNKDDITLNKYPKATIGTSTVLETGTNENSFMGNQLFRCKKGDIIYKNYKYIGLYVYNAEGLLIESYAGNAYQYTIISDDASYFKIYYSRYSDNIHEKLMLNINKKLPKQYFSSSSTIPSVGNGKAMITLIDDDTNYLKIPIIKGICDELGVKCTFACITGHLDSGYTNSNELITLLTDYQNEGFHISSHSWGHNNMWQWKDLTEEQKRILYKDLLKSFSDLESKGFLDCRMFVSPGGGHLSSVQKLVEGWADCLVNAGDDDNKIFYNKGFQDGRYNIYRVFINADLHPNLDYYTTLIDEAISSDAWLVFGTHSGANSWSPTEFNETLVKNVIQYAVDKGVDVLPLNKAFKRRKFMYDMYDMYN